MNLAILPTYAMLYLTRDWLRNRLLAGAVCRHPLGAAIWAEIKKIYELMSEREGLRMEVEARLAKLVEILSALDLTHDRKARALYRMLDALAEATDDPQLADIYRKLKELLFPHNLRVVQFSYEEEAGAIVSLESRVTDEVLRQLEGIRVGEQTLADIYRAWVEAGHALGHHLHERTRLQASITRDGTSGAMTNTQLVRNQWIRAVHMLLDALPTLQLSDEVLEHLLPPLERSVATAIERRDSNESGDGDAGDGDDAPAIEPAAGDNAAEPAAAGPAAGDNAAEPAAAGPAAGDNAAEPAAAGPAAGSNTAEPAPDPGGTTQELDEDAVERAANHAATIEHLSAEPGGESASV